MRCPGDVEARPPAIRELLNLQVVPEGRHRGDDRPEALPGVQLPGERAFVSFDPAHTQLYADGWIVEGTRP